MGIGINVYCTGCHRRVQIEPGDATLLIPDVGQASLPFMCPSCRSRRVLPCSTTKVDALAAAGVPAERVCSVTPSYHKPGPPLTLDDLLTLHQDLATL